ncbi:MAG: hypothetical protein ACI81T_001753 [Bacteroidia bacterium]|jgi:hypothetical protein
MNTNKVIYCFSLLFTIAHFSFAQEVKTEKFYRHLRYNHVSPHIPLNGIHEINQKEAENTSHYIFRYDDNNRVVEIINNHFHSEKQHPLASIGAYKTSISYSKTEEVRLFFDKNDKRISNNREVYKEVYSLDKKERKSSLQFYDLENNPMESGWKVSRYEWKKYKNMIVEKRYNLKDEPVNVSPYFEFGITGIKYSKNNSPKGHYNLNEALEITNNSIGVASYQDTYDAKGNHSRYTYHDQDNKLTKNQWGFSIGVKEYDENGNHKLLLRYDKNDSLVLSIKIPSNFNVEIAKPVTKADSIKIKEIALGYLVALQELKPDLMKQVMHEQLAKRTVGFDRKTKKEIVKETTYQQMLDFAVDWNKSGTKFPFNPNNQAFILDIYNRMASVKLVSDNWVEYLHLIKTNGEWKIINLIWLHQDANRYPND